MCREKTNKWAPFFLFMKWPFQQERWDIKIKGPKTKVEQFAVALILNLNQSQKKYFINYLGDEKLNHCST